MQTLKTLDDGCELRELTWTEFQPLWQPLAKQFFDDEYFSYTWRSALTDEQRSLAKQLHDRLQGRFELCLGIFRGGQLIGWSYGYQESGDTFYMVNSGLLPEHRRKGLYSLLARPAMERAETQGFQRIYSRHLLANNPILIAKLKLGFQLTHFEVSDVFGVLAHLTYYPLKLRQKAYQLRTGYIRPDAELKTAFNLE